MKNFFKSTAIFAFVALLFCACSEDTTEDIIIPEVESSGIRSVTPGNGKFEVKWTVAGDDLIDRCRISWSNGSDVSGEYVVEADFTQVMSYTTTDVLPAGEYTVTLENFGESNFDSSSTNKTVEVYDSSSFVAPEIESVYAESVTGGANLLIKWDSAPEDCTGLIMSYYDVDGNKITTLPLVFGEASFVENVKAGTNISYTAVFLPEGGLDEVFYVYSDAKSVPSASAISAPESVVINSGDYKFRATMTPATGSTATSAVIIYNNGEVTQYEYIDVTSGYYEITELPLETYSVEVRYISGTNLSAATAGDSEATVYDWEIYKTGCSFPEYTAMYYDKVFKDTKEDLSGLENVDFHQPLCINWIENIDCASLVIEYLMSQNGDQTEADLTSDAQTGTMSVLDGRRGRGETPTPGTAFKATVKFSPSGNGLDSYEIEQYMQFPYAQVPKFVYSFGDKDNDGGMDKYYHYLITPINPNKALATEDDADNSSDSPDSDATGVLGDSKGSQLYGEVTLTNYGISNYFWEELFNDNYDYSSTFSSSGYQFVTNSTYTFENQTLSYDLGATFQLSSIVYYPHLSQYLGSNTIKSFSLYGSNVHPSEDPSLNLYTEESEEYFELGTEYMAIPDLSNWECLLFEAEIVKPSENNIDYNGDNVVNTTDDEDLIRDGISFDIPSTASPVRYLRMQIISTMGGTTTSYIMELEHYHSGCTSGYDEPGAYQIKTTHTQDGVDTPGYPMDSGKRRTDVYYY